MKTLRLKTLSVEGFKIFKDKQTFEFDTESKIIVGHNGAGKSSIKDAIFWCLFDKNGHGISKFAYKTLDENNTPIKNLDTVVELIFIDENNQTLTLNKSAVEKWTRKKGETEETLSGTTYTYSINGAVTPAKEYTKYIDSVVSFDLFKILTDPLEFAERLDWQTRRKIVFDIASSVSDEDVFKNDSRFNELQMELQKTGLSIEDTKKKLTTTLNQYEKELNGFPVQIKEASLAKSDENYPEGMSDEKKLELINQIDTLSEELRVLNSVDTTEIDNNITKLELNIDKAKAKLPTTLEEQFTSSDEGYRYNNAINQLKDIPTYKDDALDTLKTNVMKQVSKITDRQTLIKAEYMDAENKVFNSTKCNYCGQDLPAHKVQEALETFNVTKSTTLSALKTEYENLSKELNELHSTYTLEQGLIKGNIAKKIELDAIVQQGLAFKANIEKDLLQKLEAYTNENNAKIHALKQSKETNGNQIDTNAINSLNEQINSLKGTLSLYDQFEARKKLNETQDIRIAAIKERQKQVSDEYGNCRKILDQIDIFTQVKIDLTVANVETKFGGLNFKLFNTALNGNMSETCEVLVNGVRFNDGLNTAARINTGLSIINTLSDHYQINVPILIDNAEACESLIKTSSQQIALYVVRNAKLQIMNPDELLTTQGVN